MKFPVDKHKVMHIHWWEKKKKKVISITYKMMVSELILTMEGISSWLVIQQKHCALY